MTIPYALKAVEEGLGSGRKMCLFLMVPRSSYWYHPKEKTPWEQRLIERVKELSEEQPRYGYRRIAALLRREGWQVGKRRIQSLRRSLGLRVPPSKKKIVRRGHSTGLPVKAEHKGHVTGHKDFICDATTRGGAIGMLTILDEYTRVCHVLRADRAHKSGDVLEWMGKAIQEHGAPRYLSSDIEPSKEAPGGVRREPNQNGYVESFHGRLRDECLNREQFWTLTEARVVIEDYRKVPSEATSPSQQTWTDNTFRPHSKLGYLSPATFAARKSAPFSSPVGLRPPCERDGQSNTNQLKPKTILKD